jgi:dTDP-4-amino-4,6-dideoxygalactose transaminase
LIPVSNPKASYLAHKEEINEAIARVLESGNYILAKEVEELEKEFRDLVHAKYAVAVGNGTDALFLSLKAVGVNSNSTVYIPSVTAPPTAVAVARTGATITPIRLNDRYLINVEDLEENLAQKHERIGASHEVVLPVHLYGHICDIKELSRLFSGTPFTPIIEDCAQAHFGHDGDRNSLGTWSDLACYSFYPTKNVGGIGDGGMVTTDNAKYYRFLLENRSPFDEGGINSRMDELQAAILRVKLRDIYTETNRRREIARYYFANIDQDRIHLTPASDFQRICDVFHQFVIAVKKSEDRRSLRNYLLDCEIKTQVHYPDHMLWWSQWNVQLIKDSGFAEWRITENILSIPMYPELTDAEVEYVVESINKWATS